MEHVVCFSCCKTLKPDEEILMCGICEIWQHFKCTKGVSPSFYLQFYLSVIDDSAAPAYWSCLHCTQVEASDAKKTQESSLVLPEKGHSSHKLNRTFDSTRTSIEGPAPDPTTSLFSLENRDAPTTHTMFIKPTQLGGKELTLTFTATKPVNPRVSTTANKRPLEDMQLGDSLDEGIPAKVYKTSADFRCLCDSDSDDNLASPTMCDTSLALAALCEDYSLASAALCTQSLALVNLCDDSTAIATLCAKLIENRNLSLDPTPSPDVPPSPVDTTKSTITQLSHSSDKCHVEPRTSSVITYSLSMGTGTKSFLTDSHGFTYQIKYKLGWRALWTCTEKKSLCRATVIQEPINQFEQGAASHNHGPSQSQTSTGTDPTSEAPDEQAQTSTDQGTISEPDVSQSKTSTRQGPNCEPAASQSKDSTSSGLTLLPAVNLSQTRTKPAVNQSQTSRIEGPTTEPDVSQSMTRTNSGPATEPAVSQSDDGLEKPATSQRKQLPKDQTLDQEDAGDKLPLGKKLTSTKTSKPAKKGKSIAPAKKVKSTAPAKEVKSTAPAKEVMSPVPAKNVKSTAPAEKVKSTSQAKEVKSTASAKEVKSTASAETDKSTAPAEKVKSTAPAKEVKSTASAKTDKSTAPAKEVKLTAQAKKVKSIAQAKKVKSTAPAKKVKLTAPAKKKAPMKALPPPLPLYSPPANPLICRQCDKEATFQEISTCTRFFYKKQSYLFDPEYHIYETKIEDKEKGTTTWKCTFWGEEGTKCQGKVQLDYIHEFNCPVGIKDYNWTYDHNDYSLIRTQPHNHGPYKSTAVDLKIKAHIHQLIFGHDLLFDSSRLIIGDAFDWLHDHENQAAPWDVGRRYTRYVYSKKKEYKETPASFQYRYRIQK